jgi:hypothetical protein
MDPTTRKKGQALFFFGTVACAASVILKRFDLDFVSGVCLGVSLGLFFLGLMAFYRR